VGVRKTAGLLRRGLPRTGIDGLRWGQVATCASLGAGVLPQPVPGRVGFIAAWEDGTALDAFLAGHPLAEALAGGWQVRLEPLRAVGSWPALPEWPAIRRPVEDDEPVAVLTLGRVRLRRIVPFVRASAPAEAEAVRHPAVIRTTGLARPPRMVATFSLWRTAAGMRSYAVGPDGPGHVHAMKAHAAQPFHHDSIFARFRPLASAGKWDGEDPLAAGITEAWSTSARQTAGPS
jgi:hypothetical protein